MCEAIKLASSLEASPFFYYRVPFYRLCEPVAYLTSRAVVSDPSSDCTFHLRFRKKNNINNGARNLGSTHEVRLNVSVYSQHVA